MGRPKEGEDLALRTHWEEGGEGGGCGKGRSDSGIF